jgi:hypothetical protein
MDNVKFIQSENFDGSITEYAIIETGENSYVSMTKEEYDRRQAEQSTPNLAP